MGYHRVANVDRDPQMIAVSPENFDSQLRFLKENYSVISLEELKNDLAESSVKPFSIVITLDDGYQDNLNFAEPILRKYELPAIVFVTTELIRERQETLSDTLERCLLANSKLLEELTLTIEDEKFRWTLTQEPVEGNWRVIDATKKTNCQCYKELHRILKPLSSEVRKQVLEVLAEQTTSIKPRTEKLVLDKDALEKLNKSPYVTIGSHTKSHLMLGKHDKNTQWKELKDSKTELEAILLEEVKALSYPYGGKSTVSDLTVELARQAGYEIACDNYPLSVVSGSDPLRLPRVMIRNWDVDVFSRQIKKGFYI